MPVHESDIRPLERTEGAQLTVDDALASARADSAAAALAALLAAGSRLYTADVRRAAALSERDEAIRTASRAGASVRAIARAAGIGKTNAADIARGAR